MKLITRLGKFAREYEEGRHGKLDTEQEHACPHGALAVDSFEVERQVVQVDDNDAEPEE